MLRYPSSKPRSRLWEIPAYWWDGHVKQPPLLATSMLEPHQSDSKGWCLKPYLLTPHILSMHLLHTRPRGRLLGRWQSCWTRAWPPRTWLASTGRRKLPPSNKVWERCFTVRSQLFMLHSSPATNVKGRDFKEKQSLSQGFRRLRPFHSGFYRPNIV